MNKKQLQELREKAEPFLNKNLFISFTINGAVYRERDCEFINIEVVPIGVITNNEDQDYRADAVFEEPVTGEVHKFQLKRIVDIFIKQKEAGVV